MPAAAGELPLDLVKIEEVYQALREHFVDRERLDPERLSGGAIRGIVDSLDDPFTSYFTPQRFRMSQKSSQGTFEGIGANVTVRDGRVTIVSAVPDSPAERAGLMPADIILEVDGESVEGFSIGMVTDRIRGPEGEPVQLRIERPETGEVIAVTIVREAIKHVTASFQQMTDRIARVPITQFVATTDEDLSACWMKCLIWVSPESSLTCETIPVGWSRPSSALPASSSPMASSFSRSTLTVSAGNGR